MCAVYGRRKSKLRFVHFSHQNHYSHSFRWWTNILWPLSRIPFSCHDKTTTTISTSPSACKGYVCESQKDVIHVTFSIVHLFACLLLLLFSPHSCSPTTHLMLRKEQRTQKHGIDVGKWGNALRHYGHNNFYTRKMKEKWAFFFVSSGIKCFSHLLSK